ESVWLCVFFFQAEDGIRDWSVTGVQTCALPISARAQLGKLARGTEPANAAMLQYARRVLRELWPVLRDVSSERSLAEVAADLEQIGRAAWRGRGGSAGAAVRLKRTRRERAESLG